MRRCNLEAGECATGTGTGADERAMPRASRRGKSTISGVSCTSIPHILTRHICQGEESRVVHIGARNIKPLYLVRCCLDFQLQDTSCLLFARAIWKRPNPFYLPRPQHISCQLPQPTRQPQFHSHLNSATATTTMSHVLCIDVAASTHIGPQTPCTSHQSPTWYGFELASERNSLNYRNPPRPPPPPHLA